MPIYGLGVRIETIQDTTLTATVTTKNLSRLDMYLDKRPLESLDVVDEPRRVVLALPAPLAPGDVVVLDLKGYEDNRLAAARRIRLAG
jgi:hypothetical protein